MVGQAEMSGAKQEILKRVRAALGQAEPPVLPLRNYRQGGLVSLADFIEKLLDYNAGVYRCSPDGIAAMVAHAMENRAKRSLLIPPGLPSAWLPAGRDFIRDRGLDYDMIDRSEGALTACTAAISMTGTIILTHSETEGRRALTLIPDYHLCIVRADQVVETVPEGIRRLRDLRTRPITTISGPSATADIEMTRIKGVHGPRTLDVILVE
jgi:L-lactate dehydrogenase complex protein LldG